MVATAAAHSNDRATDGEAGADRAALAEFAVAVADDLSLLASLHDREPTAAIIAAARQAPLAEQLGLSLQTERGRDALAAFARMLATLPDPVDAAALDDLAAGFTEVYLRHSYRAAPTESVWMTEDGLERQAPMFAVRECYKRAGLKVDDAASRPDDHLVLQLQFVSHLARVAREPGDLAVAARFLDEHLLRWVGQFAERLIAARAPDYYAALALVTACYADELRDHLTGITGHARPAASDLAAKAKSVDDADGPYLPGAAPSW